VPCIQEVLVLALLLLVRKYQWTEQEDSKPPRSSWSISSVRASEWIRKTANITSWWILKTTYIVIHRDVERGNVQCDVQRVLELITFLGDSLIDKDSTLERDADHLSSCRSIDKQASNSIPEDFPNDACSSRYAGERKILHTASEITPLDSGYSKYLHEHSPRSLADKAEIKAILLSTKVEAGVIALTLVETFLKLELMVVNWHGLRDRDEVKKLLDEKLYENASSGDHGQVGDLYVQDIDKVLFRQEDCEVLLEGRRIDIRTMGTPMFRSEYLASSPFQI